MPALLRTGGIQKMIFRFFPSRSKNEEAVYHLSPSSKNGPQTSSTWEFVTNAELWAPLPTRCPGDVAVHSRLGSATLSKVPLLHVHRISRDVKASGVAPRGGFYLNISLFSVLSRTLHKQILWPPMHACLCTH